MNRALDRIAHADAALLTPSRASRRLICIVKLSKYGAGIVEESAAGSGELDAARLAAEQLRVKLSFDPLGQLTKRRLLHAKPLRRARDVPFLGDSDEVPEMFQVQCHMKSHINFVWIILWLNFPG